MKNERNVLKSYTTWHLRNPVKNGINYHIKWCRISSINSRWWLNHPIEEYVRQIGSFPQIPGWKFPKYKWNHHLVYYLHSRSLTVRPWKIMGKEDDSAAFHCQTCCWRANLLSNFHCPPQKHHKNSWINIMMKFEAHVKMMSKIFPKRHIWGFWLSLMCPPGATNHSKWCFPPAPIWKHTAGDLAIGPMWILSIYLEIYHNKKEPFIFVDKKTFLDP